MDTASSMKNDNLTVTKALLEHSVRFSESLYDKLVREYDANKFVTLPVLKSRSRKDGVCKIVYRDFRSYYIGSVWFLSQKLYFHASTTQYKQTCYVNAREGFRFALENSGLFPFEIQKL
jgi:hypothetical protein